MTDLATIRTIRDNARRTVEAERQQYGGSWINFAPYFHYMLELSPESLRHVRLHGQLFGAGAPTDLLAGFNTPHFSRRHGYSQSVEGLPDRFIIEEPPLKVSNDHAHNRLGNDIKGRAITADTVRYQNYIANLYRVGFFKWIEESSRRITVMEFGGGYGAFGYNLLKLFPGKVRYIAVDLPVMLIFPGCYIATNIPGVKVWSHNPDNPRKVDLSDGNDLYLVPSTAFDVLSEVDEIDLAINTISMPEMPDADVVRYLDYLTERLTGPFLYHNYESSSGPAISRMVERFDCLPSPSIFERYAAKHDPGNTMQDMLALSRTRATFKPDMNAPIYLRMHLNVFIKTTLAANSYSVSHWPHPPLERIARRIARAIL